MLKYRYWIFIFTLIFSSFSQGQENTKGFATLDWTVAETLIALGELPRAVGDAKSYQRWVAEPKLPNYVMDLGLRNQPNPEQLSVLVRNVLSQPIHFINSSFYIANSPMLKKFGQVSIVDFYLQGDSWKNIVDATYHIAELIGKPESADQLMDKYSQNINALRSIAPQFTQRPIALVQFIDSRHLRIYAKNSLFGAVLAQLGFKNAWSGTYNHWGFETIEITQLANLPADTRLVIVKPYPSNVEQSLKNNTLWHYLPMAKDPLILPAVWTFGAIPSAQRFANILLEGLKTGGEKW